VKLNKREFQDPSGEYRGVTLWMLNDKLEKEEIVRQLRDFSLAGWGRVITRTFVGLRTPYLSKEWMALTEEIIRLSKKLDMKVWLQAGYMPSAVPQIEERFKYNVLVKKAKDEPQNKNEKLLAQKDDFAFYQRKMDHVLDLMNPQAVNWYLKKAYQIPWYDRFGEEFGKTVEAIWVDEPHFRPPYLPWSEKLPELFRQEWGYSITENLSSLFVDVGDFPRIRHHFWRTVTQHFVNCYSKRVGIWCSKHQLKFSGHLMGEDNLYDQIRWGGGCMPHYEFMQLPGIDFLTLDLYNWKGTKFLMTPKQCSSVANQTGKSEVLSEMFGASTQGLTFEDRKWIGDWLAVLGINYRCYHGSFYSMRGRRKRIYVPQLSYQQPWWQDNRLVADYFARLSYVLRQGKYQARILVLHPLETAQSFYTPLIDESVQSLQFPLTDKIAPKIWPLNDSVVSLSDNLLKIQRDFEYGDESLIAKYGEVTENGVSIGKMNYEVVILPSLITLRKTTVDFLKRFMEFGGKVFSVGKLPSRIDGVIDQHIDTLNKCVHKVGNNQRELKRALNDIIPPIIEVIPTNHASTDTIWVHRRQLGKTRLFFLANTSRTATIETKLRIRGSGKLESWNLRTGEIETIPQHQEGEFMVTELCFSPIASYVLLLKENVGAMTVPRERYKAKQCVLPDIYQVKRHHPNALTLDFCRYRKGNGAWSELLPLIGIQEILNQQRYVGPIVLRFTFLTKNRPKKICAVIEDAASYDIRVNGKSVRYSGLPYYIDKSFHPIDITNHVQIGKNVIEVSRDFEFVPEATFRLGSLFESLPGVELESIYLIGDFAVQSKVSLKEQKPKCLRYQPEFVLSDETKVTSGDLIVDGYPFYAGRLTLSNSVRINKPNVNERIFLQLPRLNATIARIHINEKEAGTIIWPPYRLEITPLVREGGNNIEIQLTNSLRNLLGPHHCTNGRPLATWDSDFSGKGSALSGRSSDGPDWLVKRRKGTTSYWTDDYFFVPFGLGGRTTVIKESKK